MVTANSPEERIVVNPEVALLATAAKLTSSTNCVTIRWPATADPFAGAEYYYSIYIEA